MENIINAYSNDQISNDQFKELIQQFPKQDVVNRLYTAQFGYPAIKTITNTTNFPRRDVQEALHGNEIYTQFKKPFPVHENKFRTITANHVDEIWSADLVMMQGSDPLFKNMRQNNQGYLYILTIIDLFSRYAWVFLLRSKESKDVSNCFRSLFEVFHRSLETLNPLPVIPKKLWVDQGSEFKRDLDPLLNHYNVVMYSTRSTRRKL